MKRTSYPRFLARAAMTLLAAFCFLGGARADVVTIGEGTVTCNTNPIATYYNYSITEQLYTAEEIGMAGTISSVSFYYMGNAAKDLPITMYMKHVDEADLASAGITLADAEQVFSGTLSVTTTEGWVTITLDTPFEYDGESNLLIGVVKDYLYWFSGETWQGTATTATMARYTRSDEQAYDTSTVPGTAQANRPNIQIGITSVEISCPRPTGLAISDITAHGATLTWQSEAGLFVIEYKEASQSDEDWMPATEEDITQNTFTLTNLTQATTYNVRIKAVCDPNEPVDESTWSSPVTFTTPESCPAPTNMTFTDITAYSANVGWTSDNENIEMRYTSTFPVTDFDDSQMQNWTTIDADGDGYTWVLGSQCGGVYLVESGSLANNGHNSSADLVSSGSYSNMSGVGALTPDNYLVSPQITLGGSITFWACAQDGSYAAEHFGVAVSTTGNTDAADFTTIQEWTLTAKRTVVLRSSNAPRGGNRGQGNWYQYTVDLSAYSGQGYVAIRHFDCTDQFILNVDDIVIEQPGVEIPWVSVNNPSNPQALTDLDPETTYMVQVRGNCDDEGNSTWLQGSFTTLPTCMVPTNLAVSNVDNRSADLAWTPNGEEDAWQICINGDEENLINVTETTYSFTGLNPETSYTVKVRAYCDDQDQSHWSAPATFTTLVACPAPTNLAVSDITRNSAVVSWTGEGDFELEYVEDVWKHYDNGVYASSMGAGGTIYWGIMLPAASLTASEPLTKVALHTTYSGEATLNVYLGGDQPTGTPAATQTFTMAGDGDFMEIALDTPVEIDGTQNLWITFYQSGLTWPADGCTGLTDPNGRWVSLDGEEWGDIASYGYNHTWMIRAGFGDTETEWVTVDNATSPQEITGLTPETNYFVRVKHVCGGIDGESDWVTTKFTTDVPCSTPTALTATPYAYSAKLSWQGTSDSYTVRYGYDEIEGTFYSEDFAEGIPADWTNDATYPWEVVDGYIKSSNAGVGSSTSTISFTMNVSTDANFEFDAQCRGEGTSTAWDKCIFSIDGTEMFRKGANGDQWDHYSFPITAGEHTFTWSYQKDSSVDPTGDYMAVDNIAIVTSHIVWNTVTAETNECTITGLTPLTSYHVQVQGDCGDYGTSEWSEIITFTTTDNACPTPTNLVADNITATTADLSWNGSPDVESFTVRYRIAFYGESTVTSNGDNDLHIDNVVFGVAETIPATEWQTVTTTETNVTLTGLTPETTYEAQVKADCSDPEEWSAVTSFTTLENREIELVNDDYEAATKNSDIITANIGKTRNVTLSGRTLFKDGLWNTICLPFDVVLEGSPLEGAIAKTLTDASTSPSALYDMHINLIFGDAVTTLEAGKPYIIRWNAANENIVNPVFENVLIEDVPESDRTISMANGNVKFIGYYDAFGINETDEDIFYMKTGKDDNNNDITTLVRTNSERILKSCRAYFQFSEYDVDKLKFTIDFGDGSTTGIVDLDREATTNSGWYTVDGKKLDKQPTRKGVYIQNGRAVVIK